MLFVKSLTNLFILVNTIFVLSKDILCIMFYYLWCYRQLQPDCPHGLRTVQRFVLVFRLSSFSQRMCSTSGVARLEWARVQRFQKGSFVPLTEFVCSANKQSPYSGNFWVGLLGLKFVIQANVKDFRQFQTKPITADLANVIHKKNLIY